MIKFKIKNRSTGKVQVAAEFECADDAPHSVKLGLAVQWAVRNKANLHGADLHEADLHEANLHGANLRGTDLHEADLHEANLHGAKSIVSFGPVGKERRIGYAVSHNDGPRIQLGCFWGTLDEACVAIAKKYGENSTYEQLARAACAVLDDSKGA
jgi:uncharacterized protein YjbI with pentapeptide repeats